jgi:class 3 adenylate cyclase
LVTRFGGEVVKFAGDALYAIWNTDNKLDDSSHAVNIERCTTCAIAINATCNNYRVSKSYNTRRISQISDDVSTAQHDDLGQGEVMYKLEDKNAEYEQRGAVLNVYCGVSEGVVAGIDVVADNRAEFFLIGKPLKGEFSGYFFSLDEFVSALIIM